MLITFRVLDKCTRDVPKGIISNPNQYIDNLNKKYPSASAKDRSYEIARILCIISKKYYEIVSFKIKGRNIHFSGEKEDQLPSCRQNINDTLDLANAKEGPDGVSFFKKKCLKSKILNEEIEFLKKNEEEVKCTDQIRKRYHHSEISKNKNLKFLENVPENYQGIDIFNHTEINLDELGLIFKAIHECPTLKYSVLFDEFQVGNIIVIEFAGEMTIQIRVDRTHTIPITACFGAYRERNRFGKILKPE